MKMDEVKAMYPIGARLWSSGLATWVRVVGYWVTYQGDNWLSVNREDNGTNWYVMPSTLYADQHHTPVPVPACGPGGGAHTHVHTAQPDSEDTKPVAEPAQHVAGIDAEEIDHDAWKSFKDLL